MSRLSGKTAIVTGAGSGFGAGIAKAMVANGAKVGVLDLDCARAEQTHKTLGSNSLPLCADVTRQEDLKDAIETFEAWAGPLDIFVNNAGIALPPTDLEDVDHDAFEAIYAVNMRSIFYTSQIVVPKMKARGHGCILNIASTAGVSPRPGLTWYNASKGWVITATRSMAVELAADNIRVNALNPVAGDTPLLATFMGEDTPAAREKFLASIPLGRFSTPQDIGNAAVYLCSDEARMVTGVAMEIDGGRCI